MPLFQPEYVNSHWNVMKSWNFDFIKTRCYKAPDHDVDAVLTEGDGDDQGGDGNDDIVVVNITDQHAMGTHPAGVSKSCVATTVKSSQRYTDAK